MLVSGIPIVDPSPCWCSITRGYLSTHPSHPSHPRSSKSSKPRSKLLCGCAGDLGDLLPNKVRPPRCDVCWFANPMTIVPCPITPYKSKNIHEVGSTWRSQFMLINSTMDFASEWTSFWKLGRKKCPTLSYLVPSIPSDFPLTSRVALPFL